AALRIRSRSSEINLKKKQEKPRNQELPRRRSAMHLHQKQSKVVRAAPSNRSQLRKAVRSMHDISVSEKKELRMEFASARHALMKGPHFTGPTRGQRPALNHRQHLLPACGCGRAPRGLGCAI